MYCYTVKLTFDIFITFHIFWHIYTSVSLANYESKFYLDQSSNIFMKYKCTFKDTNTDIKCRISSSL